MLPPARFSDAQTTPEQRAMVNAPTGRNDTGVPRSVRRALADGVLGRTTRRQPSTGRDGAVGPSSSSRATAVPAVQRFVAAAAEEVLATALVLEFDFGPDFPHHLDSPGSRFGATWQAPVRWSAVAATGSAGVVAGVRARPCRLSALPSGSCRRRS